MVRFSGYTTLHLFRRSIPDQWAPCQATIPSQWWNRRFVLAAVYVPGTCRIHSSWTPLLHVLWLTVSLIPMRLKRTHQRRSPSTFGGSQIEYTKKKKNVRCAYLLGHVQCSYVHNHCWPSMFVSLTFQWSIIETAGRPRFTAFGNVKMTGNGGLQWKMTVGGV